MAACGMLMPPLANKQLWALAAAQLPGTIHLSLREFRIGSDTNVGGRRASDGGGSWAHCCLEAQLSVDLPGVHSSYYGIRSD